MLKMSTSASDTFGRPFCPQKAGLHRVCLKWIAVRAILDRKDSFVCLPTGSMQGLQAWLYCFDNTI